MIRSARPSRSTVVDGVLSSPSSFFSSFSSRSSPPGGRPAREGPNGDGVSAASVIR